MLEKLHIYESSKQEMGPQQNNICFQNIINVWRHLKFPPPKPPQPQP